MDTTLTQSGPESIEKQIFGRPLGFFARVFGCQHRNMSRPVTTENVTYKYCSECGIRRRFNPVTFQPERDFYYPAHNENLYYV